MVATTPTTPPDNPEYDVIIVGGGFAGIGAAVGARQASPSARVLLLESESCLGGAGTHRGVYSLCGLFTCSEKPRRVVGKIWDDLRERLLRVQAVEERPVRHRGVFQTFDPEGMKVVLDEYMEHNRIDVILHALVVGAERNSETTMNSVSVQDRSGVTTYTAKAFVDASGDGDLAYHGGVSTRYGNFGTINLGSMSIRFGGLQNAKPTAEMWKNAIIAAKEKNPELKTIIPKDSSVQLSMPVSGFVTTYLASAAYDARDARSITKAEQFGRAQALIYLNILRKLPGHEGMFIVSTGPNFGTRESRHVNSRAQLKYEDMMNGAKYNDTVALGGWGTEWHDETSPTWSSLFQLPPDDVFEIPFGCLCSVDTDNLFSAGRCVDGDQFGGSAVRVMGTALATGQAAGVGAALYASGEHFPDVNNVQAVLRDHGAILDRDMISDPVEVDQA